MTQRHRDLKDKQALIFEMFSRRQMARLRESMAGRAGTVDLSQLSGDDGGQMWVEGAGSTFRFTARFSLADGSQRSKPICCGTGAQSFWTVID